MHLLNTMKDPMFRILLLAALAFSCAAHADDLSRLKTKLQQDYPQIGQVQQVNKTPVPGLYEVVTTEHLFYVDQTGQYLIDGSLYDLHSMRNLTDEHLYNFSSLPLERSIT